MQKPLFTVKNPDFKTDIEEKLQRQFFMKLIGFELTKIEAGYVEGELVIEEKHLQQNFFVHGGVPATLSDIVMGFSAYSLCPKGIGVVTADLHISYLNPGIGQKIVAKGWVDKPGNRLMYCSSEIYVVNQGSEKLVTRGISTMCTVDAMKNVNA